MFQTRRVLAGQCAIDENIGGARTNPSPDDGQEVLSKFGERTRQ